MSECNCPYFEPCDCGRRRTTKVMRDALVTGKMTHSEAPKLEWHNPDPQTWVAYAGMQAVGSIAVTSEIEVRFLNKTAWPKTLDDAKTWIETRWLEFWTNVHEAPYEGEDGS